MNQASKRCQGRFGSEGYVRKAIQDVNRAQRNGALSGNRDKAAKTGKPVGYKTLISTGQAGSDLFL